MNSHPSDLRTARTYLAQEELANLGVSVVPVDTIVFPKAGGAIATNKKRRIAVPGAIDLNCMAVVPGDGVDARYLRAWFESLDLTSLADGSVLPQISKKTVSALSIPLPNLDEQRRIVDILEDHLSRLDAADSALDAAHRRSDLLRSVTLNYLALDEKSLATLGDLSVDSGYGTSTKCVVDGPGVPVVRIPNLVGGRIDLADEKSVADPSVDLTHLMLAQDDLLIVRTNGSRDLIGRAAVVGSESHASFASYLIRFKIDMARARPQWVRIMLGAPSQRRVLEAMAASSAGQYNLGLKKLNRVPIPCPSLDEQEQLLLRFDDQEYAQDSLRRSLDQGRARSQSLRRSLLAAAFSGRLTGRSSDMEMVEEMAGV